MMAQHAEALALFKILENESLTEFEDKGLTSDHFTLLREQIEYIVQHNIEHGNVPDKLTFLSRFPGFTISTTNENWDYISHSLHEQKLFRDIQHMVENVGQVISEDSIKGLDLLISEAQALQDKSYQGDEHYDIVENVRDRVEEYKERIEQEGIIGIPVGLPGLDEEMGGLLKGEDLIVILGRPNAGKSWIGQAFGVGAWKNGASVLHYSGEMGTHMVGYRFDTLNKHFSNMGLTSGDDTLLHKYEEYANELEGPAYTVITPSMLNGEQLTVPKLDHLIRKHKPDVVIVDQLTLMDDARAKKGDGHHIRLGHIAQDLYKLSEKYKVPIVAPHQAKRGSADEEEDSIPGLGDAYGSDGVEQNATRVIGIKQVPIGIKLYLAKNRYGRNNLEFTYEWDIDRGTLNPAVVEKDEYYETSNGNEQKQIENFFEGADLF